MKVLQFKQTSLRILDRIPFLKLISRPKPRHIKIGYFMGLGVLAITGIALGILVVVLVHNTKVHQFDSKVEIVFTDPHQAVIFWHTEDESLAYAFYGTTRLHRPNRVEQTSSDPSIVHGVILEDIPLEGIYVSLHETSQSVLVWPKIYHVTFDEEAYLEAYNQ